MASRRLFSSGLRSLRLCPLTESLLKTSRISSSDMSRHFSSISGKGIDGLRGCKFCRGMSQWQHASILWRRKTLLKMGISKSDTWQRWGSTDIASVCGISKLYSFQPTAVTPHCISRSISMEVKSDSISQESFDSNVTPHIKFKRLDKTANHIMKILDKEAVEEVRAQREIPEIKPGYIVQLKVEVPENKRRVSLLKGIVIARRNAGLNSTFRIRRLVAGVGVESVFPLYSPNIKEIKVLDKKKVRRAKLYYLRDKMNALKKH